MTANKDIKIEMPKDVAYILNTLDNFGFEGFVCGGAVRDSLLGKEPKDWDITSSALPQDTISIFEELGYNVIKTGLKHGTVTVMINGEGYEITTYRVDGDYSNGRSPDNVEFTTSLREDLSRRDFTINSLAYSEKEGLIDYFGGLNDLRNKEIVCVGNPEDRLKEDKLRILRAFRFASTLDFGIYRNIFYAINEDNDISNLSSERIRSEFNKIITGKRPSFWLSLLSDFGLLDQIVPELIDCRRFDNKNTQHRKKIFEHTLEVVDRVEPTLELRLSALFHDIGKPKCFSIDIDGKVHFHNHQVESAKICEGVMRRLKYSNTEIEHVKGLVYWHMCFCDNTSPKAVKKFINNVGIDRLEDLFKLKVADTGGSNKDANIYKAYNSYAHVFETKYECERILNEKQPLSIKDLKINGQDLMNIGIKQGKYMGFVLSRLLYLVLESPELNNKENLLDLAKNYNIDGGKQ